jgi:hypothetical protein
VHPPASPPVLDTLALRPGRSLTPLRTYCHLDRR